ncbi:MAG: ribonuclease P protein component [Eubacteriales bacterium]|nr:ribonuclease P protein component [Eubacteriales bacterium]
MRLKQAKWIKENYRFRKLYRRGKFHNLKEVSVYFRERQDDQVFVAVAISRKVRGAVQRNATKRRLRAYIQNFDGRFQPGREIIFMARPGLMEAEFHELYSRLEKALYRADLIEPKDSLEDSKPEDGALEAAEEV